MKYVQNLSSEPLVHDMNLPSADNTAKAAVSSDWTASGDVDLMNATIRLPNVPFSMMVWNKVIFLLLFKKKTKSNSRQSKKHIGFEALHGEVHVHVSIYIFGLR